MNKFNINQIVKGIRCGTFVVLGTRTMPLESEIYYQVKPIDMKTGKTGRGEMAFTADALVAYEQ